MFNDIINVCNHTVSYCIRITYKTNTNYRETHLVTYYTNANKMYVGKL